MFAGERHTRADTASEQRASWIVNLISREISRKRSRSNCSNASNLVPVGRHRMRVLPHPPVRFGDGGGSLNAQRNHSKVRSAHSEHVTPYEALTVYRRFLRGITVGAVPSLPERCKSCISARKS